MPSQLTRQVFQRIISNEPIVYRGCLRRQGFSSIAHAHDGRRIYLARKCALPVGRRHQRRTLFGLGGMFRPKAPRDSREANYVPGIEKMVEFEKRERMKARLPPVEDIAEALRAFIKHKAVDWGYINDTQAKLVLLSLRYYLQELAKLGEGGSGPSWELGAHLLNKIAGGVRKSMLENSSQAHVDLARLLADEFTNPKYSANNAGLGEELYIASLTCSGRTHEAKKFLLSATAERSSRNVLGPDGMGKDVEGDASESADLRRWDYVLRGFLKENNEIEALRTADLLRARGLGLTMRITTDMLMFYTRREDLKAVMLWWGECNALAQSVDAFQQPAYHTAVHEVLLWCLASNNLRFGHQVVKDVMVSNPAKPIWDAVLVWGAGTKKSVDEVGRMLDVMERSNESIPNEADWRVPDAATVNALVRYAISQSDPYMAERIITLGRKHRIEPDAETFVLQMDYRLSVNDVDGALIAYKHLQAQDLSANSDVPAVNRLIVALCTGQRHDFETIMSVVADLADRQANFEPLTVSTLSVLHMNRDEIHDVIDLLNTHSFGFSTTERATIRKTLIDYSLDSQTTTTRAWDAYTILRSIFDEMAREERTQIMLNFFAHKRPDMAVTVFNHMRQHTRKDTMPDNDTYVSALLGCAKLKDLESMEVVHNQLKIDYNVTQNTHCRNALIIAYSLCGQAREALDFWDEIVASREGPTYNSIHIALRACEKSAFGDLKAQEIWARLRKNKVDIDNSMWASYVGALAGNGDNDLAKSTIEQAEQKGELEVDAFLLGSLMDACAGQTKQADVEAWATDRYPEVWHFLRKKIGWKVEENGMRRMNIDRTVTP